VKLCTLKKHFDALCLLCLLARVASQLLLTHFPFHLQVPNKLVEGMKLSCIDLHNEMIEMIETIETMEQGRKSKLKIIRTVQVHDRSLQEVSGA